MSGVDRVGLKPQMPQTAAQESSSPAAEGEYRGQRVANTTESLSSLIENSKEELPAHLSETSSRKLAERTAKSRSGSRLDEILRKYKQFAGSPGEVEKFQAAAESLKKLGRPTPQQLKQLLSESFADQESTALLCLEEMLSAEGADPELLAVVRDVKAELGGDLREFYQQQVKSYEGVTDVYQQLLGEHGEADFLRATELLITRLGNDLSAQGPNLEPAHLKSTIDSLYHLEVARNTYSAFAELSAKTQRLFP